MGASIFHSRVCGYGNRGRWGRGVWGNGDLEEGRPSLEDERIEFITVPRKASGGKGAGDRRHGMGGGYEVGRNNPNHARPSEARIALAELGHCPKGCECDGVGTRRVETPRGRGY